MKKQVRAGALRAELVDGVLLHVRHGEREVLRRVYIGVRDRNWGTLKASITNEEVEVGEKAFRVSYEAEYREGEIRFAAKVVMEGEESGRIRWTMEGKALSTFLKNRIGWCVLHPLTCAGRHCRVDRGEGRWEDGEFPRYAAPHQPFLDVHAMRHQVEPGVQAEVRLEGDVFEMEDQRNWTDASYKIYSTPLRLPFPAKMEAGAEVRQVVTLRLLPEGLEAEAEVERGSVELKVDEARVAALPAIGLSLPRDAGREAGIALERLRTLKLAHLRAEIDFRVKGAEVRLAGAGRRAAALGVPLEVALKVTRGGEDEMRRAADVARERKMDVCRWLILPVMEKAATAEWMGAARRALGGSAELVAGTDGPLADLNRNRPAAALMDGASFSACPQMHAADDVTIAENAAGLGAAVEAAVQFVGEKPVHVTPVTLGRRPQVDERQRTGFGAVWTAATLKHLAAAGAASVTYYETEGPGGVMTAEGEVYPVWQVLRDVGEFAGGTALWLESSRALEVDGVVLKKGKQVRLLAGNFTDEAQVVRIWRAGLGTVTGARITDADMGQSEEKVGEGEEWVEFRMPAHGMLRVDGRLAGVEKAVG